MCGIVGYIGDKRAQEILTSGLRRLEYRGYDSAGIATLNGQGDITLLRKKGKVAELDLAIEKNETGDAVGIGHTRWATHGEPSERNAHPHTVGDITLVHNGIIENYKDLKSVLEDRKYTFQSDTDSEVLAALIDSIYQSQDEKELLGAVAEALDLAVGAYGIAVLTPKQPDQIIVARKGSPLLLGVDEGEVYIGSDASAILGHTDQIIYLKDGEIGRCSRDGVELFDINAQPVEPIIEKLEMDLHAIQKKGYDHFLLKEINEQADTLRSTLAGRINHSEGSVQLGGPGLSSDELRDLKNIIIVGCGTAYYAGQLASYYIEQLTTDVAIQVEIASELRYRSFNVSEHSVALIVSQSGETADTLACLQELKRRGVRTIGVVNAVGSTIAREVDSGIYLHVGAEISVASTKAFTSQVAAMVLFGITIAQAKGTSPQLIQEFIDEIIQLPEQISAVIKTHSGDIKQFASKYKSYEHSLFVGRDTLFPVALEGALKLKEISYIQAEGYASGELKHGPIALIDDRFFEVALLADNWLYDKSASNIAEVNSRGGHILTVTNTTKEVDSESLLRIDTKLEHMLPLLFNVTLQLFAYYVALERGNDVDQPRNLAKSVTVE